LAQRLFSLVVFRLKPFGIHDENELDSLNASLLEAINLSGKAYLSHTRINGKYALRMSIGQTYVTQDHIVKTWDLIKNLAKNLHD
jgi:aromatic-L-amino-acid decarboxylase